jgi:hypothetical protein
VKSDRVGVPNFKPESILQGWIKKNCEGWQQPSILYCLKIRLSCEADNSISSFKTASPRSPMFTSPPKCVVVEMDRSRQTEPPTNTLHIPMLFVMTETWHRLLLGPLGAYSYSSHSLMLQPIGNRRKNNHMEGGALLGTPLWG